VVVQEERSGTALTAAAAGLAAAVVGGVVWALIVRWTEYEIGFVAWGIGFLVGTAVAFGAGGARGIPLQILAVVLALVGIVIGKYLSFVWVIQDELPGIDLPVFSRDTIDLWWDARSDVWGGWDLLWVGLAVFTAFRIPQHERDEPAEPAVPPPTGPGSAQSTPGQPAPPTPPGQNRPEVDSES
jgi:hypothetical protein